MLERTTEQLEEMARECRELAAAVSDNTARRDLSLVAEKFERLARHHQLYETKTLTRLKSER